MRQDMPPAGDGRPVRVRGVGGGSDPHIHSVARACARYDGDRDIAEGGWVRTPGRKIVEEGPGLFRLRTEDARGERLALHIRADRNGRLSDPGGVELVKCAQRFLRSFELRVVADGGQFHHIGFVDEVAIASHHPLPGHRIV